MTESHYTEGTGEGELSQHHKMNFNSSNKGGKESQFSSPSSFASSHITRLGGIEEEYSSSPHSLNSSNNSSSASSQHYPPSPSLKEEEEEFEKEVHNNQLRDQQFDDDPESIENLPTMDPSFSNQGSGDWMNGESGEFEDHVVNPNIFNEPPRYPLPFNQEELMEEEGGGNEDDILGAFESFSKHCEITAQERGEEEEY